MVRTALRGCFFCTVNHGKFSVPGSECRVGVSKEQTSPEAYGSKTHCEASRQNRPEKRIWHDSPEKRMPRNGAEAKREEHAKLKTKVRSEAEWT